VNFEEMFPRGLNTAEEGDAPKGIPCDDSLPEDVELESVSEAPHVVRFVPDRDPRGGVFEFLRAGHARVVLTYRTKTGEFLNRKTVDFFVRPAHWVEGSSAG
jgi:transglutaminase-like putative cysteine protease